MDDTKITVRVDVSWWLKPYLYGTMIFAFITGMTPDAEKMKRMIKRALSITYRYE